MGPAVERGGDWSEAGRAGRSDGGGTAEESEDGLYYSLYEWYNPLWLTDKPKYIREHMTPQFKDLV